MQETKNYLVYSIIYRLVWCYLKRLLEPMIEYFCDLTYRNSVTLIFYDYTVSSIWTS
jgi:hypothetical protein